MTLSELAPDRRKRGRDDRLVERRQKHRQHHADDDGSDLRMRQRSRAGGDGRGVHGVDCPWRVPKWPAWIVKAGAARDATLRDLRRQPMRAA